LTQTSRLEIIGQRHINMLTPIYSMCYNALVV
jgi:hypothetical protein